MNYKTALITGASAGIGRAIATALAEQGVNLVLVARRRERLEQLQGKLAGQVDCRVVACDITDRAALQRGIDDLPQGLRQVDVLVNCAGLALGLGPAHQAQWPDWETMIDTNCKALAFLTRLLLPGMVARNRGHIVNIGSIAGNYPYYGGNVYGATKAFVEQFTLNLKADLLGTRVRVTNVEPGMVGDSEFSLVRFKGDEDRARATYQGIDCLRPEDIAASVVWALTQPERVNINRIEIMPVSQAPSRTAYFKEDGQ